MNKDCKILKEASINVRQWIEKQPNVKEESLTDCGYYIAYLTRQIELNITLSQEMKKQKQQVLIGSGGFSFQSLHIGFVYRLKN